MLKNMNILNLASAMSSHSAQRHAVIAENIANADTPGYKAKDVQAFSEVYKTAQMQHKPLDMSALETVEMDVGDSLSPNGNSVSLEEQMMKSTETVNDHELALMVYKKSLSLMKMAIGKNL